MGREKPVNIMYICEHNGHWSAQRRDVFVFKWKWFSSIFFYCIVFLRDECPNFSYLRNVIISNKNFITRTNQLSFTFLLFEYWLNFFFRLIRKSNDILISCRKKHCYELNSFHSPYFLLDSWTIHAKEWYSYKAELW